jgi:DNA-binding transcriptional MerR regulator/effector-binding domain-containing protein
MLSIGELARLGGVSTRTLRHYGELGLLLPARVDPTTGYRSYELAQLGDLHRILALRDLGFALEEIGSIGHDVGQLRALLQRREQELAGTIAEEQDRLRRVAAHLDAIERGGTMRTVDTVVKTSGPLRAARITVAVPAYGNEHIDPVFDVHLPQLWKALLDRDIELGIGVAEYEEPKGTDDVLVHVGYEIGTQTVPHIPGVTVVELSEVEVVSTLVRGPMRETGDVYEALVRWVDAGGYSLHGWPRQLHHQWGYPDPRAQLTEIQLPISR